MLPSSLTEVRSLTWGEFPLPTGVGLRYGHSSISLEAFLGGLGLGRLPPGCPDSCQGSCLPSRGFSYDSHFPTGNPSCPFDGLTFPTASPLHSNDGLWCRTI